MSGQLASILVVSRVNTDSQLISSKLYVSVMFMIGMSDAQAEYHRKQLEAKVSTVESMQQRGAFETPSSTATDTELAKLQKDLARAESKVLTEKQKYESSQAAHRVEVLRLVGETSKGTVARADE